MLSLFKEPIYYVQISKNSFTVRSVNGKESIVFNASTPFSTKRLLIGEFTVAEKLLKKALSSFPKSIISPTVIMHPLEMVDEKLSEVEKNVFREVALAAGARDVKLWLGKKLSDNELVDI